VLWLVDVLPTLWCPLLFGLLDLFHVPDESLVALIICGTWHDTKGMKAAAYFFDDGQCFLNWGHPVARSANGEPQWRRIFLWSATIVLTSCRAWYIALSSDMT
jgi:hypothetical protein